MTDLIEFIYQILNAGVSFHSPFENVKEISLYKTLMEVNYLGYVYCTYYALPYLKKSHGQIGVVASLSGDYPRNTSD